MPIWSFIRAVLSPFGAADLSADGETLTTSDSAGRISVSSAADGGSLEPVLRIDRQAQFFNPADGLSMLHGLSVRTDGQRILTVGHDGVARLWSATSGDLIAALEGQAERTLHAQFGPDGRQVWIADARGAVFLWDSVTRALQRALWPLVGSGPVSRLFYADPDGRHIAAGAGGTLRLRDHDHEHEHEAEIHLRRGPYSARYLETSTDGRLPLTVGGVPRSTVRVWDIASREWIGSFDDAREHQFTRVRLLADGRYALSGGGDGTVRLWDVSSGRCLHVLEGHRGSVHSLAVTADGSFAMSASGDLVRMWELDWEWDVRKPADWDDGARPHLEGFLFRFGNTPEWTEAEFEGLMRRLQDGGYGWLRKGGIRAELGRMASAATEADSVPGAASPSLRERLRRRWAQRAVKGEGG
ncbi:hypothetical protein AB0P15_30660 [Streptomyces sp. NPDC087917]|uniref:WD40 repeat domain-containing protein n=1 Tax=Streptomyces sp. NPDC087917 TaxID=3155060 RepID=UPI0034346A66